MRPSRPCSLAWGVLPSQPVPLEGHGLAPARVGTKPGSHPTPPHASLRALKARSSPGTASWLRFYIPHFSPGQGFPGSLLSQVAPGEPADAARRSQPWARPIKPWGPPSFFLLPRTWRGSGGARARAKEPKPSSDPGFGYTHMWSLEGLRWARPCYVGEDLGDRWRHGGWDRVLVSISQSSPLAHSARPEDPGPSRTVSFLFPQL